MRADLHIHTTASDGRWSPETLIQNLLETDITLFAVTDHDSINNVLTTEKLANQTNLHFIRGVEISTTYKSKCVHVLGYGINPASAALKHVLSINQKALEKGNRQEIAKLISMGYNLSLKEYEAYTYDQQRGGWKSLNFVIDNGIAKDLYEYSKNIYPKIGLDEIRFIALEDAVRIIKQAEGIPILAHPGASFADEDLEEELTKIKNLGIAGVECYAQYHDEILINRCVHLCNQYDLLITGGSDYHGGFVNRTLGVPKIDHIKDLYLGPILHQSDIK
jgi:predicted metal-dependent phosphoesterase TrpH